MIMDSGLLLYHRDKVRMSDVRHHRAKGTSGKKGVLKRNEKQSYKEITVHNIDLSYDNFHKF